MKNAIVELAAHLPTTNRAMVGMATEMKSTTTQVLHATPLIQCKSASALVYNGTSVSLLSFNVFNHLGFSGAKEI